MAMPNNPNKAAADVLSSLFGQADAKPPAPPKCVPGNAARDRLRLQHDYAAAAEDCAAAHAAYGACGCDLCKVKSLNCRATAAMAAAALKALVTGDRTALERIAAACEAADQGGK